MSRKILIVGSGNAALCAGIAALEKGADVLILEKADKALSGGNTKYCAGAIRFTFEDTNDLLKLMPRNSDPRIKVSNFGSYPQVQFESDLASFNDGLPLSDEQKMLVTGSYETMLWLASHNVAFEPIFKRQSIFKDGVYPFWGGCPLVPAGEGPGLHQQELAEYIRLGGKICYKDEVIEILVNDKIVIGLRTNYGEFYGDAVILGAGGFESDASVRAKHLGEKWRNAKVRGTPHNTGECMEMAFNLGAVSHGRFDGCHATPMDLYMKDFGNLNLEPGQRKNYRKICYHLGLIVNKQGIRFLDEGENLRTYTYAQVGSRILDQVDGIAYQLFDAKVMDYLYEEYFFYDAHYEEAQTIEELAFKIEGVNKDKLIETIRTFNAACGPANQIDPSNLDGNCTKGLEIPKTNWAQRLDTPPFRAYPVTGGISFTYGGLKVSKKGEVLRPDSTPITGLYACGEIVGGVFFGGYPGGAGLTAGAVFGRAAGYGAAGALEG